MTAHLGQGRASCAVNAGAAASYELEAMLYPLVFDSSTTIVGP